MSWDAYNECADLPAQAEAYRADELARNGVEGKFGNAKRKGTLARVMAKLRETSVSVVNIALVVLNLDTRLREELFWLCDLLWVVPGGPPEAQIPVRGCGIYAVSTPRAPVFRAAA